MIIQLKISFIKFSFLGACSQGKPQKVMQQEQQIDENLYSRQIAVYGAETQAKLVKMHCFLYGLRGLGIEVAKNLVLAGPSSLTIFDSELVSTKDLRANFYTTEAMVGKLTRAQASVTQLKELNPYVTVKVADTLPSVADLSSYSVVIITDNWDKNWLVEVSNAVHAKGNGFIYGHVSGLFGSTFVDFGEAFNLYDPNGEDPKSTIISGITQDQVGTVTVHEDKRHGFSDGDWVTFREVLGMTQVNDKLFQIKVSSPYNFTIGDTSAFAAYQREGICEQVKVPKKLQFKSFASSLTHPWALDRQDLDLCDWEKIGRPEQLHIAFNALLEFAAQNKNQLPEFNNEGQASEIFALAKSINESERGEGALKAELDEQVVKNCSRFARAQISPIVSFWGGVIAQEVVKFTGKFTPLRQWLHNEFFEALPDQEVNRQTLDSPYDDIIAIFGQETLQKLNNLRAFMVGAGALGCEFVKMFAMLGLGESNQKGGVLVTDDDNIEISNLNRQFLFRKADVSHNKAKCACRVGQQMNPKIQFKDYALRVGQENEKIFNDIFWEGIDIAVNAVDNVHARRYIDDQCCYYGKPLFESGTLGTKCNSQLILPNSTQSYSESQDPPEDGIPLCTLKNFPYQIEHTIQYARDYFQGVFADGSIECIKYLEDPAGYIQRTTKELKNQPGILRPRLENIKSFVQAYKVKTYQKCVELARNMFQDNFYNSISQLLFCFPIDHKTTEGQLFWSNPKRPPTPINYDEKDELHLNFVQAAANIFAYIFGLPYELDKEKVRKLSVTVKVDQFQARNVQLKENEKDTKEEKAEDDEETIAKLVTELQGLSLTDKPKLQEVVFEKDDPTNWHIDFTAGFANLRARNYKIAEVSPFKVKLIAGKIIPALATTTAMIVGAVGLEIIKYVLNKKVDKMRNSFINLALPLFLFSEPLPPNQHKDQENSIIYFGPVKAVPPNWTAWDRVTVKGPLTVQQFIDHFKTNYKVEVTSMTAGRYMLFSSYPPPKKEFLEMDLAKAYESKFGPLPKERKFLDLVVGGDCEGEAGKEPPNADIAPVKYQYNFL